MMLRSKKLLVLMMLLMGAIIIGPSQGRAGYGVRVYDDGVLQGGIGTLVIGNSLIFTGNTTHFSITSGSGSSNNPGTLGGSNLALSSNEQINATFGASGGTHTIRIELSQDTWLAPTGTPLILSSSVGGSFDYLTGSNLSATQAVTATYQGFLDNTNALFGQPGAGSTPLQTASASRNTVGTTSLVFSPGTAVNPLTPGGTPFSMTDVLSFTFALDAGSGQTTANVSASTVATVPEPASLIMALTGLPALALGFWVRRRRQSV